MGRIWELCASDGLRRTQGLRGENRHPGRWVAPPVAGW